MKVLLTEDIPKIGHKNEIVEVSDGYAKNFLLPNKKAIIATPQVIAQYKQKEEKQNRLKEERIKEISLLTEKLSNQIFKFKVKTGKNGEVFSSVHDLEIKEKILEFAKNNGLANLTLENIHFSSKPIKELGAKNIEIKIGEGDWKKDVRLKIEILPSDSSN